jgi:superfamily II DNA/RNA helicase
VVGPRRRELAEQAVETLNSLTECLPAERKAKAVAVVAGDKSLSSEDLNCSDIVAASYGSMSSAIRRGLKLDNVQCVVLDESDELLEDSQGRTLVKLLFDKAAEFGRKPQLLSFSATFDALELKPEASAFALLREILGDDPVKFVASTTATSAAVAEKWLVTRPPAFVTVRSLAIPTITHLVWKVAVPPGGNAFDAKLAALSSILPDRGLASLKTLVFCNTRDHVKRVATQANAVMKCQVNEMSGHLESGQRRAFLASFRRGDTHPMLVSTNVLAKGLDVPSLQVVVHFDLPGKYTGGGGGGRGRGRGGGRGGRGGGRGGGHAAAAASSAAPAKFSLDRVTFIHRSGRVGRNARKGVVISMVSSADEMEEINALIEGEEYKYFAYDFAPPTVDAPMFTRVVADMFLSTPRGADRKPEDSPAMVHSAMVENFKKVDAGADL